MRRARRDHATWSGVSVASIHQQPAHETVEPGGSEPRSLARQLTLSGRVSARKKPRVTLCWCSRPPPNDVDMSKPATVVVGIGTRPEAIKVAPVYKQLVDHSGIEPLLLCTGQHMTLVDQVLDSVGIQPAANLESMRRKQSLPELGARILSGTAAYLREARPDYVLVQGDTLSTFSVAWAAHLEGIPVGHIEAGLRSFDLAQPFPEEGCRRLTDPISDSTLR